MSPSPAPTCAAGDGNGDHIADSLQANVTSLPNSIDSRYVTLAVQGVSGTPVLASVQAVAPLSLPVPPPNPENMPVGIFDFKITGVASGGTVTVTVFLPVGTNVNSYFKFIGTAALPAGEWVNFAGATGFPGGPITLTLTDGGAGDGDRTVNGEITDPGGPALLKVPRPRMLARTKAGGASSTAACDPSRTRATA